MATSKSKIWKNFRASPPGANAPGGNGGDGGDGGDGGLFGTFGGNGGSGGAANLARKSTRTKTVLPEHGFNTFLHLNVAVTSLNTSLSFLFEGTSNVHFFAVSSTEHSLLVKLSSASGVCNVIEVFVASHPTCEHFGDIVASNCSTDLPPTFVMLNGRCVASPSPSTLAVPLNSENRFGLFVFGAIGGHVHCHSARHSVSSASEFGLMMQVIAGTHFEDDDDDDATQLLVVLANNERRNRRRRFFDHHQLSTTVVVVVSLLRLDRIIIVGKSSSSSLLLWLLCCCVVCVTNNDLLNE